MKKIGIFDEKAQWFRVFKAMATPSKHVTALFILTVLPLFGAADAFAGSPFYLTAEHSFAAGEPPQVRLDYTVTDQPMLVRVLKPKNLESFLDGQLNLSRSYEEPVSELNPGHYFAKGVNAAESPLRLFRGMLDPDFRKSLQGTSFNKAIINVAQKPLVSVPQQILVAPPAGFQTIKESYLDLQNNGVNAHDLGWWFNQDSWSEQNYKVRKITLDPLPDGIYLLQAVQGKTEAQCLIQVSSLAVQVKQSSEQLLVRVITRALQPVSGARVSYRDARERWVMLPATTDAAGELRFNNPDGLLDGKLVVRVDAPGSDSPRTALTSTDFLPAQSKDDAVFVVTDRPIFKPGETFYYKGIVRKMNDGQLSIPSFQSGQADISLIRADGNATGLQGQSKLSEFGSFSGSFDLDEAQTPGLYRLLADIDHKPYGGEFRVRDYVKPSFYLELIEHSPVVTPGQPFKLKFRAKRYSGGAPQNARFEVFLYRKKFEAPQFVDEAGAGLTAGSDYSGSVKSATQLIQPQRVYSSIEERQQADNPGSAWDSAPGLAENGDAGFEFTVPGGDKDKPDQEWIYTLMVRAQDSAGSQAILTDNIYATLSEAQPAVRFNKTIAAVGEQDLKLQIQSSYADGRPAAQAGGVIDVLLEQPGAARQSLVKLSFTTDAQGRQELAIPALNAHGRLSAIATLETLDGRKLHHAADSQPATLIVAGNSGEAVADNQELELYTSSTILSPGEHAKVFALLPKDWGKGESGSIWETVAGTRIFDSRSVQAQGRSRWFEVSAQPEYGTGFYHTVTVPVSGGKYREQTLGFRIVPWDKRLNINILPEKSETEPLKPTRIKLEVKRADGSPAANTELSVSIVDRAVYAVQAEFRPGVFDFFYPLQRINLSTFYSDELQGYGYADLLRKPNFALSALKSQSKLAKKAMRDTAGWFPHVVTDAKGWASVDVNMPANVTEWLVTAIAGDREGRLGETTGGFRTVADVSVDLVGPQFLREGDETDLIVKLISHVAHPVKLAGKLLFTAPLQLISGGTSIQSELKANDEYRWPLRIAAQNRQGKAGLQVELAASEKKIRIGGAEEFEIPLRPAAMEQVYAGVQSRDTLKTEFPSDASVRKVRVQINSGLLGAALQAAEMLVQYPYGCTEQLAHSTIPNLVLMDLLARADVKPDQLGPLAKTLERAQQNAAIGLRKIIRNQKSSGGFSLWPGEADASLPVTLIALKALKFASDLNVEGAAVSYGKGMEWLAQQLGQNADISALTGGFVLAGLADVGELYDRPWQQQADFVKQVAGSATAPASDLIDALRIVKAYEAQDWHSFNQQFKDRFKLKSDLILRLQNSLDQIGTEQPVQPAGNQIALSEQLGFGFGLPSLMSAGMGTLNGLQALPPALELKLKKQLLQTQKNGYWVSTYDTAQVIFNTRDLISREAAALAQDNKAAARKLIAITKDGAQLGSLGRIPGGYLSTFTQIDDDADLSEIRLPGLKPDEVATSTITVDLPYASVDAVTSGLQVERSFRRITGKGSEPLDLTQALKPGDVVVSEVHVKRPADTQCCETASRFVVVEDGIPSLAEGQEADQTYLADAKIQPKEDSYWSSIKETQRYPDRIVRIARIEAGGEFRLYQVWRVARAGRASIAPARAFDMYHEAVRGNSKADEVIGGALN
ncbi:MG2 domain-containing protein [Candidatus Methylospira mobilis]|uniref:MG2 domain-containing protein n=1 Tax=Candidatus Methylospira mobilis TaxID=1808979 RepID=UPI0028E87937|nr:MG2 domain-containing protein [Candidatus Methylospira mobilis]WNV03704.1 MG2 domain-containing protein [Candidatus Methylospira mobilis]